MDGFHKDNGNGKRRDLPSVWYHLLRVNPGHIDTQTERFSFLEDGRWVTITVGSIDCCIQKVKPFGFADLTPSSALDIAAHRPL
jgi:hypothetical protein